MPVHEDRSDVTRFSHVDTSGDAESLIAFLDTANALAGLRAAKQSLADQLRLAQARSVLDIGCGTGADLIAMAGQLPPGGRATGIDVSESMIAEARRRASGLDLSISFDSGDAANLPYEDASFGACRVATVLLHVRDASQVIREMIRVTRPGGRVAALEFDQDTTMLDHPDRHTTRIIVQLRRRDGQRLGRAAAAAAVPPGGPDRPVGPPGRESRRGRDVPRHAPPPRRPALRGQRPDRRPGRRLVARPGAAGRRRSLPRRRGHLRGRRHPARRPDRLIQQPGMSV
jgi:ubiquinone/menaquinone biosynthesis C-methylase UbiE